MVTAGDSTLRKEFVDTAVKAIALQEYKLKTLCTIDSSSAYTEKYWRETNSDPTTVGVAAKATIKGTPRLAPFPFGEVAWTLVTGNNQKYACEGMIAEEDELMGYLPMIERTLVRIGRAVARAQDEEIAAQMLANAGNTFAIAATATWNNATIANRDPVYDILFGIDMLRKDNIDALKGNGYLCLNGTDYTNVISNSKFTNNPSFKTADVVSNGVVGEVCGLKIMVTEALEVTTPDVAYIVMKGEAMIWKEVKPLTVEQIRNPGINTVIRAYSYGHCQVVTPNAICKITNTRT